MDNILTELYKAFKPDLMSLEEIAVLRQGSGIIEKVEKQLTFDDFENFWFAMASLNDVQAEKSFALGFRLGAHLMLEITREYPTYGRR